jgi:predicted SnoaL-like aldol condensation-catalyzing enzyme
MKRLTVALAVAFYSAFAFAAIPVVPAKDQAPMIMSKDSKLATNKKLCYDFFRIVLRARHLEQAEKFMKEDYIQHNPNAETGIKGFKDFFTRLGPPTDIKDMLPGLVAIQAEGDFVTLSFVSENENAKDKGKKYTTTWFDMFRIENGKIAEHWDSALLQ